RGGAAAMSPGPPVKADEFVPHPVKEQLPGVDFCLTSPPPWRPSLSLPLSSSFALLLQGEGDPDVAVRRSDQYTDAVHRHSHRCVETFKCYACTTFRFQSGHWLAGQDCSVSTTCWFRHGSGCCSSVNLFEFQGIGILLDGMFGTANGSAASV
ncbi:hypothetical protein BHE74_00053870, partial [Ensete ventricosum]